MPKETLRDFIKSLIVECDGTFNEKTFWDVFNRYFDKEFYALYESIIVNGDSFSLPTLENVQIANQMVNTQSFGFNYIDSLKTGFIHNLNLNSNAAKSGITEGAKFEGFSLNYSSNDMLQLTTTIDGQTLNFVLDTVPQELSFYK